MEIGFITLKSKFKIQGLNILPTKSCAFYDYHNNQLLLSYKPVKGCFLNGVGVCLTVPQKVNLYKCNSGWAQAHVPLRVLRLSPASIISPMLHAHLHRHYAVFRRTIRRSLSNFQRNHLLPKIGRTGKKTTSVSE